MPRTGRRGRSRSAQPLPRTPAATLHCDHICARPAWHARAEVPRGVVRCLHQTTSTRPRSNLRAPAIQETRGPNEGAASGPLAARHESFLEHARIARDRIRPASSSRGPSRAPKRHPRARPLVFLGTSPRAYRPDLKGSSQPEERSPSKPVALRLALPVYSGFFPLAAHCPQAQGPVKRPAPLRGAPGKPRPKTQSKRPPPPPRPRASQPTTNRLPPLGLPGHEPAGIPPRSKGQFLARGKEPE